MAECGDLVRCFRNPEHEDAALQRPALSFEATISDVRLGRSLDVPLAARFAPAPASSVAGNIIWIGVPGSRFSIQFIGFQYASPPLSYPYQESHAFKNSTG